MNKFKSWKSSYIFVCATVMVVSPIFFLSSCCGNDRDKENIDEYFQLDNDVLLGLTELGNKQTNLVIPNRVTHINSNAFNNCKALERITIPSSVTHIGQKIFDGCSRLTDEGVSNYSRVLFDWWVKNHKYNGKTLSQMSKIDLKDFKNSNQQLFTKIDAAAFEGCEYLQKITISKNIKDISDDAFVGVLPNVQYEVFSDLIRQMLLQFNINADQITLNYGNFIIRNVTLIGLTEHGKQQWELATPDNVSIIHENAFKKASAVKKITIDPNVIHIGPFAFTGCKALEELTFLGSTALMDQHAFFGIPPSVRTNIPDLEKRAISTQAIKEPSISVKKKQPDVTQLPVSAPILQPGTTSSSEESDIPPLKMMTRKKRTITPIEQSIPPLVKPEITPIEKPSLVSDKSLIEGDKTYYQDNFVCEDNILVGLTSKGMQQDDLEIPNSVHIIGPRAFDNCSKFLKIIKITESVKTINATAFMACPPTVDYCVSNEKQKQDLLAMSISDSHIIFYQGNFIIQNKKLIGLHNLGINQTEIVLPDNITAIGPYVFRDYCKLKKITISKNINYIDKDAFFDVNEETYFIAPDERVRRFLLTWGIRPEQLLVVEDDFTVQDNKIFGLSEAGKKQTTIIIPSAFDAIGPEFLSGCAPSLEKVVIYNTIKNIHIDAFSISPLTVKYFVFNTMSKQAVENAEIPDKKIICAQDVFIFEEKTITGLTDFGKKQIDLFIPKEVTALGEDALRGCLPTAKVFIHDAISTIDERTFRDISSEVKYYATNEYTQQQLINKGVEPRQIIFERGDFIICNQTIIGLTKSGSKLSSIFIPNDLSAIGASAFNDCASTLQRVVIPNTIEFIHHTAFQKCPLKTKYFVFNEKNKNALLGIGVGKQQQISKDNIDEKSNSLCDTKIRSDQVICSFDVFIIKNEKLLKLTEFGKEQTVFILPDGLKTIESNGFQDCLDASEIFLPNSINKINKNAFIGISNKTRIHVYSDQIRRLLISKKVKSEQIILHSGAFITQATTLIGLTGAGRMQTNLIIPDNIAVIDANSLADCSAALMRLTIHNNVKIIHCNAFGYRLLRAQFHVYNEINRQALIDAYIDGNRIFTTQGIFVIKNVDTLVEITKAGQKQQEIVIPDNVTVIGPYAFNGCRAVKRITIPNSVADFCINSFTDCPPTTEYIVYSEAAKIALQKVQIFKVIVVGNYFDIDNSTLNGLTAFGKSQSTITIPYGISQIGPKAFSGCTNLQNLTLPESLVEIGSGAFEDCTALVSVDMPTSLEKISKNAFKNCSALKKLVIPQKVTFIGYDAFDGCTSLQEVTNNSTLLFQWWVDHHDYNGLTMNQMVEVDLGKLKNSNDQQFTNICTYAFQSCELLENVLLPYGVKVINAFAFVDCPVLTSIIFPESVVKISEKVFFECHRLKNITIFGIHKNIMQNAFIELSPEAKYFVFEQETKKTLKNMNLKEEQINLSTWFVLKKATLIGLTPEGKEQDKITIPNGVSAIGKNVFKNNDKLKSVTIPKTVAVIAENAFKKCTSLKEVNMQDGVKKINDNAFKNCKSLENLTLSNQLEYICSNAFYNCKMLKKLTIPQSVISIDPTAFSFCKALKSENVVNHAPVLFYWWVNNHIYEENKILAKMPEIELSQFLNSDHQPFVYISAGAFEDCKYLKKIIVNDGVKQIDRAAFRKCKSLERIMLPETLTAIKQYAFADCGCLQQMTIPKNVVDIGNDIFQNCNALKFNQFVNNSFVLFDWVAKNYIHPYDSNTMERLSEINLDDWYYAHTYGTYEIIGDGTFKGFKSLKKIIITDGVTHIGSNAFEDCTALETVIIPDTVQTIDVGAFLGCTSLKEIIIPKSVLVIKNEAFKNCSSLGQIIIPENVQIIGNNAFEGCNALIKVEICTGVTSVGGNNIFKNCNLLKEVIIPATVTKIGRNIFDDNGTINVINESPVLFDWYTKYGKLNNEKISEMEVIDLSKPIEGKQDRFTIISDFAFTNLNKLKNIYLSKMITYIGQEVFKGCLPPTNYYVANYELKDMLLNANRELDPDKVICTPESGIISTFERK